MTSPVVTSHQRELIAVLGATDVPQSTQELTSALFRDDLLPGETTSFVERVHGRLTTLAKCGLVDRHPGRPATWSLTDAGRALHTGSPD